MQKMVTGFLTLALLVSGACVQAAQMAHAKAKEKSNVGRNVVIGVVALGACYGAYRWYNSGDAAAVDGSADSDQGDGKRRHAERNADLEQRAALVRAQFGKLSDATVVEMARDIYRERSARLQEEQREIDAAVDAKLAEEAAARRAAAEESLKPRLEQLRVEQAELATLEQQLFSRPALASSASARPSSSSPASLGEGASASNENLQDRRL